MSTRLGTGARNAGATAVVALLNGGACKFYVGAQPATVASNPSGTLLGNCALNATAGGAASTGVVTFNAISSDTNAPNSGTIGHGVLYDSGGTPQLDFACGTSGSDMNFDSTTVVAGGVVAVSALSYTQPT